jgi:hypothetical protein
MRFMMFSLSAAHSGAREGGNASASSIGCEGYAALPRVVSRRGAEKKGGAERSFRAEGKTIKPAHAAQVEIC